MSRAAPLLALLLCGCYLVYLPADPDAPGPEPSDPAGDDDDSAVAPADDDDSHAPAPDPDDDDASDDDDTGDEPPVDPLDDDDATPDPLAGLDPAHAWIRSNPMFVTGLTVSMPVPSPAAVDAYFDDFGASALHTWARGVPNRVAGWAAAGRPDFAWLSWVQADGTSVDGGAVIGGMAPDSAGRIGFQVGDEPRNFADVDDIALGVDAVRAADPDALIVINFGNPDPGVSLLDLLEHAAATIDFDIASYDLYSRTYDEYERMALVRQFALDHGMPYWRYLKSFAFQGETDWPEPSDLRWDAMAGVVQGYTGHTWFLYQVAPPHPLDPALFDAGGDWTSPANARHQVVSTLNAELAVLGQVLPWLTSTDVRYTPGVGLYAPAGLSAWSSGAGGDPWIASIQPVGLAPWEIQDVHVGFFVDDAGEQYVALQNPTYASADWPVMVSPSATFEVRFDFASAPPSLDPTQLLVLDHHSGAVVTEPLSPSNGQRLLSVTLDAGDLVFFKYDTGAGFAGLGGP